MLKKFFKNFLVALLGEFLQTLEVAFFIYGSKHIWRRGNLFLYDSDNLGQKEWSKEWAYNIDAGSNSA